MENYFSENLVNILFAFTIILLIMIFITLKDVRFTDETRETREIDVEYE